MVPLLIAGFLAPRTVFDVDLAERAGFEICANPPDLFIKISSENRTSLSAVHRFGEKPRGESAKVALSDGRCPQVCG
jgi:hypothetical protein